MPEVVGRLRTPRLAGAPATPAPGEIYFDTGTSTLYFWSGTSWLSAQGTPGPPGTSGASTFISGTGAPTAGVGVDGSIYLDTASGKMWGPKAAGAWPGAAFGRLLLPGNTYADVSAKYGNYAALVAG